MCLVGKKEGFNPGFPDFSLLMSLILHHGQHAFVTSSMGGTGEVSVLASWSCFCLVPVTQALDSVLLPDITLGPAGGLLNSMRVSQHRQGFLGYQHTWT